MLPKQVGGTFRKHVIKPHSQPAALYILTFLRAGQVATSDIQFSNRVVILFCDAEGTSA